MSVFKSATCKMTCSRRRSDVLGKVAICARAWPSCSAASTSAERSCDRCPALPHRCADFSIRSALCVVTRQQLGLALGDFRELTFENFGDARMQHAPWLSQQRTVGCVLHQRMLEQVARIT